MITAVLSMFGTDADPNGAPPDSIVQPGWIGLLFFIGLFVATYFLWKSMNKHLGRIDPNLPEEPPASGQRDAEVRVGRGLNSPPIPSADDDGGSPSDKD
jgi:hypothetical protein